MQEFKKKLRLRMHAKVLFNFTLYKRAVIHIYNNELVEMFFVSPKSDDFLEVAMVLSDAKAFHKELGKAIKESEREAK